MPLRDLPRYVVRAKTAERGEPASYTSGRRFSVDMLKELFRVLGRPAEKLPGWRKTSVNQVFHE